MNQDPLVKFTDRAFWQARYSDGRVLSEWETNQKIKSPFGDGRSSRWEEIPKENMVGLRLLCPNGEVGVLEHKEGGLFFQFKVGVAHVGLPNQTLAHIIGLVDGRNGECLCWSWNGTLGSFRDNIRDMKYMNIGPISVEVQGMVV